MKYRKQLKYIQEDIITRIDVLITVLLFGFKFPSWVCWLALFFTVIQYLYAGVAAILYLKEKEKD